MYKDLWPNQVNEKISSPLSLSTFQFKFYINHQASSGTRYWSFWKLVAHLQKGLLNMFLNSQVGKVIYLILIADQQASHGPVLR